MRKQENHVRIMNGTATVTEILKLVSQIACSNPGLYVFCEYRICKVFLILSIALSDRMSLSVFSCSYVFRKSVLILCCFTVFS